MNTQMERFLKGGSFLKKYTVGNKKVFASSYAQAVEQVNLMKKGA
jgi:hypothetical protein